MTNTRNIGSNLNPVCQANTSNLTKSRVRLLRRRSINPGANTTLLRAALQSRCSRLISLFFPTLTNQLIDRWHTITCLPAAKFSTPKSANTLHTKNEVIMSTYILPTPSRQQLNTHFTSHAQHINHMVGDGISVGPESHQHLHPLSATKKPAACRALSLSRDRQHTCLYACCQSFYLSSTKKDCMRLMPHAIRVQL